jgi:hypothetical protein
MSSSRKVPRNLLTCGLCLHFVNDPKLLERSFVGISALSSAFGSTRGQAGICLKESTFHDPEPVCLAFEPRLRKPGL